MFDREVRGKGDTLNCSDVFPGSCGHYVISLNNPKLLSLRNQLKSPFIEEHFDKCAGLMSIAFRHGRR